MRAAVVMIGCVVLPATAGSFACNGDDANFGLLPPLLHFTIPRCTLAMSSAISVIWDAEAFEVMLLLLLLLPVLNRRRLLVVIVMVDFALYLPSAL